MRLDLLVARRFGLSRRAAREAVRAGRIAHEGSPAQEPGAEVSETARLEFFPNRPQQRRVATRLAVLLEDDDFVIVDKPAGLLTVPTAERERDTLLARTLDYLHKRYRRRPFAGTVHRLDKDTSGALLFSRNRETTQALQALLRRHDVEREYIALVEGDPGESGTFDEELVRDAGDRRRGIARGAEGGRRAVTHWRRVERLEGASLVAVRLETGRTHQIRIHFSAAGHPVLGDRVYGRRDIRGADAPPRQMLHARVLGFVHPRTGLRIRAESPLPEDFTRAVARLRVRRGEKKAAPEGAASGTRSRRR
jgi:23S rRNA pseudouridine1911/1915/1917 synthase